MSGTASGTASEPEAETETEAESESESETVTGAGIATVRATVAAAESVPAAPLAPLPRGERTQFVLMGMDTTPHWERRGFEDLYRYINLRPRAAGQAAASFTLFIGSGGLQLDETRTRLSEAERVFQGIPPRHNPVFDYAESLEQIRGKAENIRRLDALGVEIGSHTVRHENGEGWSRAQWAHELTDHARILQLAGLPQPMGFRAPFLGRNANLYAELAAHGYRYDASETQNARRWPVRRADTQLWQFGIPSVTIPGREGPVLFFDLNMENRLRRAAAEAGVRGEGEVLAWIERAYFDIALAEFSRRYRGARAPFLISGHGGFRDAITRLMRRVCTMEHVRCATFREATEDMQAHPEMEGAE